MSRIRTIKPEWLTDERMALASSDARVLSIALIVMADDYGRGRANRVMLAGQVFPGKNPETLAKALDELATGNFVLLYEVDGQSYYAVRNWEKHQRVDKPGKPRVPAIPDGYDTSEKVRETSAKVPESLATDHDLDHDHDLERSAPKAQRKPKAARKTVFPEGWKPNESHVAKARELGLDLTREASKFENGAIANGRRYVDWDRAFHAWLDRAQEFAPRGGQQAIPLVPPDRDAARRKWEREQLERDRQEARRAAQ